MGVAAAPLLDCKSALGAARCGIVAGCAKKREVVRGVFV